MKKKYKAEYSYNTKNNNYNNNNNYNSSSYTQDGSIANMNEVIDANSTGYYDANYSYSKKENQKNYGKQYGKKTEYYGTKNKENYNYTYIQSPYKTEKALDVVNNIENSINGRIEVGAENKLVNDNLNEIDINKPISQEDNKNKKNTFEVPELTRKLITELIEKKIECLVCSEEILHENECEIWSCDVCYSILHIKCIKNWINKLNSNNESKEFKFTCPHCSNLFVYDKLPVYNCFCGKYNTLKKVDFSSILIPHTCGKKCEYNICEHINCSLPCHPGPHIVCKKISTVYCYCNKEFKELPCNVVRDPNSKEFEGYSCERKCGKSLVCGYHSCTYPCHNGECPGNEANIGESTLISSKCEMCLKESELKIRTLVEELEILALEANIDINFTSFLSDYLLKGKLPCGKHYIENFSIEKTLKDFFQILRISGDNLLVNLKTFIPICSIIDENTCRCESYSLPGKCYLINYKDDLLQLLYTKSEELSLVVPENINENSEDLNNNLKNKKVFYNRIPKSTTCNKPCRTLKSCKNHSCMNICCPLKGKIVRFHRDDPTGAHLCFEVCGKKLKCGKHNCIDNCHRGDCLPCFNIIRDNPLICDCGAYKLDPPYKCTQEPQCNNPCLKPSKCAHGCKLKCHRGECPPCLEIITKKCDCGESLLQNVICSEPVKCGKKCGELLPCGCHFCNEICHEHVENPNFFCSAICNRQMLCGHHCRATCHGEDDCSYSDCSVMTTATCKCGENFRAMPCQDIQRIRRKQIKEERKMKELTDGGEEEDYTHDIKILECNENCTKKERLQIIENSFKGLLEYSADHNKMFIKAKPISTEDPKEISNHVTHFFQLKYTPYQISFAVNKSLLVSKVEDFTENYLSNITNKKETSKILTVESKYSQAVCDFLVNIYNVRINKGSKSDGYNNISITSGSSGRLPKFRLSLLGLLFKHTKFIKPEYNNEKDYPQFKIYHPFEQSILIKNYRVSCSLEEIESHLLKNNIVQNEDDFYISETCSQLCYIHFFDAKRCVKAYNKNINFPSQFQECYLIDQYAGLDNKDKSEFKNAVTYTLSKEFLENLYKYKKNTKYFELLNEYYDNVADIKKEKKKEEILKNTDDEGFVLVTKKKKK